MFKNSQINVLFIFIIVLFTISLYQAYPNFDEAIFAAQSYSFNTLGYVKSDLYSGYSNYDWDAKRYQYHKFFILLGAWFSSLFGFKLYTFKSISLIFSCLLFGLLYRYSRAFLPQYSTKSFLKLLVITLLCNNIFFSHAFMYRPEIAVACFGFASFYYLKKNLVDRNYIYVVGAGIWAGFATFTHLNGLIFCSTGFIFLLLKRNFKDSLIFGVVAGLTSLLYLFDLNSLAEFQQLYLQLTTDPNILVKDPAFISLLKEHRRFFWDTEEVIFSCVFLIALISSFRQIKQEQPDILIYLGLLIVSLGLLAHGKTVKYALNYYPFMALIIAAWLSKPNLYPKPIRFIFAFLFIAYLCGHTFYNLRYINQRIDLKARNTQIKKLLPETNVKIGAPAVFIFNGIGDFTIRGPLAFDHYYQTFKPKEKRTLPKYLAFSQAHRDKYVVVDKRLNSQDFILEYELENLNIGDTLASYHLIEKTDGIFIFKK